MMLRGLAVLVALVLFAGLLFYNGPAPEPTAPGRCIPEAERSYGFGDVPPTPERRICK